MNILRGILASIFIFIFTLVALVTTAGFGLEHAITPQTAAAIIERAKVGERLIAALPELIKQGMKGPASAQLRVEDIQRFVAEALPADQLNSMLKSVSGEVLSYIRGEGDMISKIDLAPIETRAETAAKKSLPGKAGVQMAAMIKQQFKTAGLDKGLEIPREQLDPARNAFMQFRLGEGIAIAIALLALLLAFAVAPHGLSGRLRWCGIALIIVGCLSAAIAVGSLIAPSTTATLALSGNAPPEIQGLLKDAVGVLGGVLAMNIFIVAAVDLACGIALLVFGSFLHKRRAAAK